jgi:hypothetical protein
LPISGNVEAADSDFLLCIRPVMIYSFKLFTN